MSRAPRVSIGLPVHDGENYVAQAIESILAQTFEDFELVVSDNASSDATEEICRAHAAKDPRVRYLRSERNLGAAPNFNRAWEAARGEYFRWAAHDDLVMPMHLEECVRALDEDPGVVLAHTAVRIVDEWGRTVRDPVYGPRTDAPRPSKRFHDLLFVRNDCFEVFGLIRSEILAKTGLMGAFPVGDRVLLSELAFRGRFHEHPEPLFLSREHAKRSVRSLVTQQERAPWFDTRYAGKITFPEWKTFAEYCKAIRRSPLRGRERLLCELHMVQWLRRYRKRMRHDVWLACRQAAARSFGRPRGSSPTSLPH